MYNVVSFAGIFVLMAVAWCFSTDRRRMNWRVIGWAIALQLAFGLVMFKTRCGHGAFIAVNTAVDRLMSASWEGIRFVLGPLGDVKTVGFVLAFHSLPMVVFFSALMAVLYHYRVMPMIIRGFAWVFTRLMRISGAESLCAASNIFVGIESAITIKPHLEKMTRSELCTVLTVGMATVASTMLGAYVGFLKDTFPNIAGHLVSASILSAPAALMMSKIIVPETGSPETLGMNVAPHYEREDNVLLAIIKGANSGVVLGVGIVALLLAVLGLKGLVDMFLVGVGWRLNAALGWGVDWSLSGLLGYLFQPLMLVIGVPLEDVGAVARIVGARTVVTELTAYQYLADVLASGGFRCPERSAVMTAYALCGFAHVASMAVFVGGASALAPSRARDLSAVALRALLAATLACLVTACVAGVYAMAGDSTVLLGAR